jgi:phosphomethylpyrimidine synthase
MLTPNSFGIQEIEENIFDRESLKRYLDIGSVVTLKGNVNYIGVGSPTFIKVNTSIGCNNSRSYSSELRKLDHLASLEYRPDMMMDLSIVRQPKPLYKEMVDRFEGPVGTLPHYLCYTPDKGIDPTQLLEEIESHAEAGVSWLTLHISARRDIYELAKQTRHTPITSRGGGLAISDIYINRRSESIFEFLLYDIFSILKKHNMALSLGTTFRPATIIDAMDEVHIKELELQGKYISEANRHGVPVLLEAIGHVPLDKLHDFATLVRNDLKYNLPLMTLGPIPTDSAVGSDHISNAIGSAYAGMLDASNIVNSVTSEEHTGKVPSFESIVEGLKAARIAAHTVNSARFPMTRIADVDISEKRARNYTCVVEGGLFTKTAKMNFSMGCTRCGHECPLLINRDLGRIDNQIGDQAHD